LEFSNFETVFFPSVSLNYLKEKGEEPIKLEREVKSLDVSYNVSELYKGGVGFYAGIKAIDANIFLLQMQKNELAIASATLFLEVLEIEKRIDVYEKFVELNQKTKTQLEERVRRGSAKPSSLYLVEAQLEEALSSLELEKNKLETAKSKFFSKTGLEAKNLIEPKVPQLKYKNLEELIEKVKKENLALKSKESLKTASKYNLAYTSSQFLPDVSVSYQKYTNANLITNAEVEGSKITLSARFYLYKPGLISDVIQKGYEYQASKFAFKNEVDAKVDMAKELWNLHEYHKKVFASREKVVKARRLIAKEKGEDYTAGRAEITAKLDEEKNLLDAELVLIQTKFQNLITIYKIKNIAGEYLF
jgi:adhesin transport system outer membrane protein